MVNGWLAVREGRIDKAVRKLIKGEITLDEYFRVATQTHKGYQKELDAEARIAKRRNHD